MNFIFQQKKVLLFCLFLLPLCLQAQTDSTSKPYRVRNIAWFTPSGANEINGVAIGLQAVNIDFKPLKINGLNADIAMASMFLLPYAVDYHLSSKKKKENANNNSRQRDGYMEYDSALLVINGISLSMGGEQGATINGINLAGGLTGAVALNGISVSGLFTRSGQFNGISIAGIHNYSVCGRGLQIGLVNHCRKLKGLQIGLWNKSGKRGLPFINWGF